jgi:hypothetical protein
MKEPFKNMLDQSVFIPGDPRPFATSGTALWSRDLSDLIPIAPADAALQGLTVDFVLNTGSTPCDIDNLCEPVFAVLVGQRNWFSGRRPDIIWFRATKHIGFPTGCTLQLFSTQPPPTTSTHHVQLNDLYPGPLPQSAHDSQLAQWCRGIVPRPNPGMRFSVDLEFGTHPLNIAEIPTGSVKHIIDCLYPLLGGVAGKPHDDKVDSLFVVKGLSVIPNDACFIRVAAA